MKQTHGRILDRMLRHGRWAVSLLRNLRACHGLPAIASTEYKGYRIAGLERADLPALRRLHRSLRNGSDLTPWRRILYRLHGRSLVAVARDPSGNVVGFEMFYFEKGGARKAVIHAAFIGVAPHCRNMGLATRLRQVAARHFAGAGLRGISSRVREDNVASLRSAIASGFEISHRRVESDGVTTLTMLRRLEDIGECVA
ncbi:GNAT family N-acetyltransferase [Thioalkalivibrio thiocyanodenitrificans]|uniref:GNAT family N-acetyltransferase n=1 Tax=Thioalkalivibrio thiocyanodenitrificans TaxID=243063 RepID=UPI00036270FD|nr:GNAT family N-acetyltransferase [Thioalkalivibrio thiocyanodenitrificans]